MRCHSPRSATTVLALLLSLASVSLAPAADVLVYSDGSPGTADFEWAEVNAAQGGNQSVQFLRSATSLPTAIGSHSGARIVIIMRHGASPAWLEDLRNWVGADHRRVEFRLIKVGDDAPPVTAVISAPTIFAQWLNGKTAISYSGATLPSAPLDVNEVASGYVWPQFGQRDLAPVQILKADVWGEAAPPSEPRALIFGGLSGPCGCLAVWAQDIRDCNKNQLTELGACESLYGAAGANPNPGQYDTCVSGANSRHTSCVGNAKGKYNLCIAYCSEFGVAPPTIGG